MWSTLIIFFVFAVAVSFVCSLLEATVLSTTHAYVESLVKAGKKSGTRLRRLKHRVDRSLIAILTLNTVANMFGAAGVGNEAGKLAREAGTADNEALFVSLASGVLTLTILVFSEIVPKTLGATYWRSLAGPLSPVLSVMVLLLSPVVLMLQFVPRLVGGRDGADAMTREDLAATAEMVHASGDIPEREALVIANLLTMSGQQLKTVLTPRVEMLTFNAAQTSQDVVNEHMPMRFSRVPVSDGPDSFMGIVLRAKLHEAVIRGDGATPVGELTQPVRFVPETKTLASMLEEFLDNDEHLALVVNEHGSVEGLVTMEDIIETLLGTEIMDELDAVADLREIALARAAARRRRIGRRVGGTKS
jgi:CBS domain containing-hemolysin-like protein